MDLSNRSTFLNMSAAIEGLLVLAAFVIGAIVEVDPIADLRWDLYAMVLGVAGAIPMLILFLTFVYLEFPPLTRIREFLMVSLGPPLAACRWYDIVLLALLAGLTEEILFRGTLQPWLEGYGESVGLWGSNLIFGLLHSVTWTYGLWATAMGVWMSWLMDMPAERNLLTPIVAHAVYDYLAFLILIRIFDRARRAAENSTHNL